MIRRSTPLAPWWLGSQHLNPPSDDSLNDVVRQMDENEDLWNVLKADLPPKLALSQETEEDKRRRAAQVRNERLGQRNIWYRKDESGLSPADRYFGEGGS